MLIAYFFLSLKILYKEKKKREGVSVRRKERCPNESKMLILKILKIN